MHDLWIAVLICVVHIISNEFFNFCKFLFFLFPKMVAATFRCFWCCWHWSSLDGLEECSNSGGSNSVPRSHLQFNCFIFLTIGLWIIETPFFFFFIYFIFWTLLILSSGFSILKGKSPLTLLSDNMRSEMNSSPPEPLYKTFIDLPDHDQVFFYLFIF